MEFIKNNLGTIVVLVILLAVVTLIVIRLVKNKRNGKTSCGCGCEYCENAKYCHKNKTEN